jgi:hypothetical protein
MSHQRISSLRQQLDSPVTGGGDMRKAALAPRTPGAVGSGLKQQVAGAKSTVRRRGGLTDITNKTPAAGGLSMAQKTTGKDLKQTVKRDMFSKKPLVETVAPVQTVAVETDEVELEYVPADMPPLPLDWEMDEKYKMDLESIDGGRLPVYLPSMRYDSRVKEDLYDHKPFQIPPSIEEVWEVLSDVSDHGETLSIVSFEDLQVDFISDVEAGEDE